jgi:cation diffusion facilitator family transporter
MSTNVYSKVKKVVFAILWANLLVAISKLVLGYMMKSSGLTADGFHSLTDASSNVVALIGVFFASKPIDEDHPYGHNKFETLAGLFIAGMLFFIGSRIILSGLSRFFKPTIPEISLESILILLIPLFVNVVVCVYEYKKGKELNSQILIADSMHTKSDIYVSTGVIITLTAISFGAPPIIDSIASLIVAVFILHAGYEIFQSTSGVLVDKVAVDTQKIEEILCTFEEVKGFHKIRSRGTEYDVYIDMHVKTDPNLTVEASHDLTHQIENRIREELRKNAHVIVHIEPFKE